MQAAQELRIAVVGCGAVAQQEHLPAIAAYPRARLVATCDRDVARARALAAAVPEARAFGDPSELLETSRPDVVLILTRPESHAELAIQALAAGAHVLVEKPFVYRLRDAEAVLVAAKAAGRRVSAVHNGRFHPAAEQLDGKLAAGDIGELISLHFLAGRRDQRFVPSPWYFETHGGRLGETLPHALYQLVPRLPDLTLVHARATRLGHVHAPDFGHAVDTGMDELHAELATPDGRWASILYSLNSNVPQSLLAVGTRGTLQASLGRDARVARWHAGAPSARQWMRGAEAWARQRGLLPRSQNASPQRRMLHDFLDAIVTGSEPRISETEVREVVRLWEAIVERTDLCTEARQGDCS